jgi:hypothetical protein
MILVNGEVNEMEQRRADCESDYDKRILMRKLLNREMSEEKLEKYLAELPDVSSCAEEITIE